MTVFSRILRMPYGVVDFTTVNRYFFRRFYSEPHFVTPYFDDHDDDIVIDDDALILLAGQDKHDFSFHVLAETSRKTRAKAPVETAAPRR